MPETPDWLDIAQRLQAIAQTGLEFCHNDYDRERYKQIRELSVEILEKKTLHSRKDIIEFFASADGYPTPKVDVRAAIFKGNSILLVKEKVDGRWSLPGGWADQHLSLSENIIKESQEEAGVQVSPVKIISVQDRRKHNYPDIPHGCYKIFVECSLNGGKFEENTETSEADFFGLDELPELSTERNTEEQIELCFRARENNWKTSFD